MKRKTLLIAIFLFLFLPNIVYASDAKLTLEGKEEVIASETFEIDIMAKDIEGSNLMTIGGSLQSDNPDCLEISKIKVISSGIASGNKFAYSNGDGIKEDTKIARISLIAKKSTCRAEISINDPKLAFTDGTKLILPQITKIINVINLEDLKLSKENIHLRVNETLKLNIYVPNGISLNPNGITWKSIEPNIVTIDSDGRITAKSKGKTTIEATYQEKKMTTKVEVVDYLKGDVNHDGLIDLSDVLLALRIQMGLLQVTDYYLETGDINEDQIIDLTDVLYILRTQMNLS